MLFFRTTNNGHRFTLPTFSKAHANPKTNGCCIVVVKWCGGGNNVADAFVKAMQSFVARDESAGFLTPLAADKSN